MAIDNIMRIVAGYFGVSVDDIKGRSRAQNVSVPRKIACYVIKHTLPITYDDLGTYMGTRDHSTVMYYCKDVRSKIPTMPAYQMHLRAIDALLEQHFSALDDADEPFGEVVVTPPAEADPEPAPAPETPPDA